MVQCAADRVRNVEANDAIADIDRRVARRSVHRAEQPGDAGRRLHEVVVHGLARLRPFAAITNGKAVNDPTVAGSDAIIVQAEPGQTLRAHIRHQHVRAICQLDYGLLALRRFKIKHDAALVAVRL